MSSGQVWNTMAADFMKRDCVERLEYIINTGLPTLIYNG